MTNQVDELQQKIVDLKDVIKDIQEACEHEFTITKPHGELKESLVPGVYLGFNAQGGNGHLNFTINCPKCSLTRKCKACFICPKCFSTLEKDEYPVLRQEYWERPYIYYGSLMCRCPNRHFRIVNDEWNQ